SRVPAPPWLLQRTGRLQWPSESNSRASEATPERSAPFAVHAEAGPAQRVHRRREVRLLDEDVIGVEGGEREEAQAGPGQATRQRGQHADLLERDRPFELERAPAGLDPRAARSVLGEAYHRRLFSGAGDGAPRPRARDGPGRAGGETADREPSFEQREPARDRGQDTGRARARRPRNGSLIRGG